MAQTRTTDQRIAEMRRRLEATLQPTVLDIADESHKHVGHDGAKTGRGHFHLTISSAQFEGKSRIDSHRMVYDALAEMMETDIHALIISIK